MAEAKFTIKLGLAEYTVEFDTAALMFFEETTRRGLTDFVTAPRVSDTIQLLWAALRRNDQQMTLAQVQELAPPRKFAEVAKVVAAALADALGAEPPAAGEARPLVPTAG